MNELNDFYAIRLEEILTSSNEPGGFVFNIGMDSVEETRKAIDIISKKIRNAFIWEWEPGWNLEIEICERCINKIEYCLNDLRNARRYDDEASVERLKFVKTSFMTCIEMLAREYNGSNALTYTNAKMELPNSLNKAINDFHDNVLERGKKFLVILNVDSKEQLKQLHNIRYLADLANNDNIVLLVNVELTSVYFDALVKGIDCCYGVSRYENGNDFLRPLALADRIFNAEQGGKNG